MPALDWWPYRFQGLPVVAREDATREMEQMRVDYGVVVEILETGEPTGFQRAVGTVERSATRRGRRIKVVVRLEKDEYFEGEEVWRLIHVGPDTHR